MRNAMEHELPAEQEVYKSSRPSSRRSDASQKDAFKMIACFGFLARSACKMKASSRVLLIHQSNDHAPIGVGTRCVAGKCALSRSLRSFPLVPELDGQLFRKVVIFDCSDFLDRAVCERLAFGKISVRQLYDLRLVFQKIKTDLAPFAVVVCPIRVDCNGDFFVFLLL